MERQQVITNAKQDKEGSNKQKKGGSKSNHTKSKAMSKRAAEYSFAVSCIDHCPYRKGLAAHERFERPCDAQQVSDTANGRDSHEAAAGTQKSRSIQNKKGALPR